MRVSVSIYTQGESGERDIANQSISFGISGFPKDYTLKPLARIVSDWLKENYVEAKWPQIEKQLD